VSKDPPSKRMGGAKVAAAGLTLLASLVTGEASSPTKSSAEEMPPLTLFPEAAVAGTGDADEEGEVIVIDTTDRQSIKAMIQDLGFEDAAQAAGEAGDPGD